MTGRAEYNTELVEVVYRRRDMRGEAERKGIERGKLSERGS